jgi:hypothetical protein
MWILKDQQRPLRPKRHDHLGSRILSVINTVEPTSTISCKHKLKEKFHNMTYEIEYDDVENVLAEVVIQRIAEVRSRMQSAVSSLTDADLQRFLMFHKYNLETAIEAIEKYLRWREEKRLDELQLRPDGINVPHILHVRKFTGIMEDANFTKDQPCLPKEYKRFYEAQGGGGIHGVDKEGRPIYIARIGQYNVQKLADTCPAEVFENYHIRAYEFVYKVILPEASRLKGGPIEQITNIFDCTGMVSHHFLFKSLIWAETLNQLGTAPIPYSWNHVAENDC